MASMYIGFKSGKPGKAAIHAQYIVREGVYRKGDKSRDLVAKGHGNLPAEFHSPLAFWKAADSSERINAAAYREIVAALPRELTLEQQIGLTEEYIDRVIPGKPYEYAIHWPTAALGGGLQPHVHLMFSDRIPDGVGREPEQFFRRYNALYPERGGCRKDSGGKDPVAYKQQAKAQRDNWAEVTNESLERFGHDARVDPRSYRAQGLAIQTERHLGPAAIRKMSLEDKKAFRAKRYNRSSQPSAGCPSVE